MARVSSRTIYIRGWTRYLGILAIVCGAVSCSDDQVAKDSLSQGLQAVYSFSGNAGDGSGNGNDGTLIGSATANGVLAIGPNGADALSLPYGLADGLGAFTFAAWVRIAADQPGSHQLLSGAIATQDNNLGIWFSQTESRWSICLFGDTYPFAVEGSVLDHDWHHVAVLRASTSATLYVDGALVGAGVNVPETVLDVDPGGLFVGQDQDVLGGDFDGTQSWSGEIDELRIYNRALAASELASLQNRPLCPL